jgi:hypothetical protein
MPLTAFLQTVKVVGIGLLQCSPPGKGPDTPVQSASGLAGGHGEFTRVVRTTVGLAFRGHSTFRVSAAGNE